MLKMPTKSEARVTLVNWKVACRELEDRYLQGG